MHHALVERIYSLIIVILDEMNSDDNYDYIFKVGGTEAARQTNVLLIFCIFTTRLSVYIVQYCREIIHDKLYVYYVYNNVYQWRVMGGEASHLWSIYYIKYYTNILLQICI